MILSIIEILLTGVALAMDALAVSILLGISLPEARLKDGLKVGAVFGGFQALMPTIGYFLGRAVYTLICAVDHYIAFGLLAIIGGKMLYDAIKGEENTLQDPEKALSLRMLLPLALATSIDALAVGVSMAMMAVNIWVAVSLIGIVTLVICLGGLMMGKKLGAKLQSKAQLLGGIILICIGLKILLEGVLGA